MNNIESNKGEIVMYQPDETIRLEVRVEDDIQVREILVITSQISLSKENLKRPQQFGKSEQFKKKVNAW